MPASLPTGDAPLCDCWTTWNPNWNRQIPAQLQAGLQQALDGYQPICDHCRLARRRCHCYARAIATSYGEVRRQIPCSAAGSVAV